MKPASTTSDFRGADLWKCWKRPGLAGWLYQSPCPVPGREIGDAMLENQDIAFYSFYRIGGSGDGRSLPKTGLRQCFLGIGFEFRGDHLRRCPVGYGRRKKCVRMAMSKRRTNLHFPCSGCWWRRKIKDEFVALMLEKVKALKIGDPFDPGTDIGSR